MSERPHEKMEFNGYLVFLDAQSCQVALSKLDAERVCAVRASMFGVDRHVAHIHHRVWGAVGTWWPSIHALGGVAETAIAGAVFSTLHYGGNRTEAIARAHAATRDEARREVLASLHRPTAESVLNRASTPRGACRLSIGLGAFLPASGRDEREFSLGRDQLLSTVTETNAPGPYYAVHELAPAAALSSPAGTVGSEVVVAARGDWFGAMTDAAGGAKILRRVTEVGARDVVLPLSAQELGIPAPALLVPDPCSTIRLSFTAMEPFDETHPLEGVTLLGAGRVLDRLRCEPRSDAIDTARSLLALTMIEGVVAAVVDL